ncbi:MAG TPA: hypothetical protein PKC67_14465 [Kiritimatiellia bacterium]|nr:hypothetical protein [Kiritimatiellia bacterium]HMP35540.1 hypothetical protein [Kiritimatiellia bacterium]
MSRLDDQLAAWVRRLRWIAYGFGFAGMLMMLAARKAADPAAQQAWSQRSFLCMGVMVAVFAAYYILSMLRIGRR